MKKNAESRIRVSSYVIRVAGCGIRVAGKKGHRAWGIAHRVKRCKTEDRRIKGVAGIYMVDSVERIE